MTYINSTRNILLIRVDASNRIGTGHLMRCLSIAAYLRSRNINVLFLTNSIHIERQVTNKGFDIKILPKSSKIEDELSIIKFLMIEKKIRIMLLDINNSETFSDLDIYHHYLERLRKLSLFLISFEDVKGYSYASDIVIIPYFGAESIKFHNKPTNKYLLGPEYFLLREEFLTIKPVVVRKKVENILITMGGGDPEGITLKILDVLNDSEFEINLNVIIGQFSHITDVQVRRKLNNYRGIFTIIRNADNIAKIMSESDIAVINSGLTKYEISAFGLPGIVISNNEKHSKLMDEFAKYGSIIHLGSVSAIEKLQIIEAVNTLVNDYNRRKLMSDAGKSLIDGKAMDRIFSEIPKDLIYA